MHEVAPFVGEKSSNLWLVGSEKTRYKLSLGVEI